MALPYKQCCLQPSKPYGGGFDEIATNACVVISNCGGRSEPMEKILQFLKKHGESLDAEIAVSTGIPLNKVRLHLAELAVNKEVVVCHSTKFEKGKKIQGITCRLSGFTPPAAPGRKSKAQLNLS